MNFHESRHNFFLWFTVWLFHLYPFIHLYLLDQNIPRDAIIDLETVTHIPHTQTKDHWPVDALPGLSLTVHGVFTQTPLKPGNRRNTLVGMTASIDTHMSNFSSESLT